MKNSFSMRSVLFIFILLGPVHSGSVRPRDRTKTKVDETPRPNGVPPRSVTRRKKVDSTPSPTYYPTYFTEAPTYIPTYYDTAYDTIETDDDSPTYYPTYYPTEWWKSARGNICCFESILSVLCWPMIAAPRRRVFVFPPSHTCHPIFFRQFLSSTLLMWIQWIFLAREAIIAVLMFWYDLN